MNVNPLFVVWLNTLAFSTACKAAGSHWKRYMERLLTNMVYVLQDKKIDCADGTFSCSTAWLAFRMFLQFYRAVVFEVIDRLGDKHQESTVLMRCTTKAAGHW